MIAVNIKNLTKEFIIPHQKKTSIRENFVNLFRKSGYEVFNAVDNISFELKKGEFFGIIGKNGSGKSTLLKLIANIYKGTKGSVDVEGKLVPFLELGIGFNPELTGRDNVYLNGAILGLKKHQIDERYNKIVEFAELGRFMDQKLKNFSSGMQSRLAFSVALEVDADIYLLDEVLAVGDINFQEKCLKVFNKLKESGKTVILVSHGLSSIENFCDRVLVMKNGKQVYLGDAKMAIEEYTKNC